ncbi:MAG: hypothetical protein SYC29_02490 [Planctomycetota bacterium]|nr:hypothetical protein [Planctomycetota bacterium]
MRRSRRWLVFLIGLPIYTAMLWAIVFSAFVLLNMPGDFLSTWQSVISESSLFFNEPAGWLWCTGPALLIAVSQALMVGPLVTYRPVRSPRARSLVVSLLICALVASMLVLALLFGMLELADVWSEPLNMDHWAWGGDLALWLTLPVLLAGWAFWSLVFFRFTRRERTYGTIGRLIGILLAGTIVETILLVPVAVLGRRPPDCYCATGTFHALLLSTFAVLWLAGPGALIVFTRRRRRRWADTHCLNCGYEKGPSPGEKCPECGFDWREAD